MVAEENVSENNHMTNIEQLKQENKKSMRD